MSQSTDYTAEQPSRADIDAITGPVVINFGTNWCGVCNAARPVINAAVDKYPGVRHIKVEDGSGRALGRSFKVKLWPTLVFMKDGSEVARIVRPNDSGAVEQALAQIDAPR